MVKFCPPRIFSVQSPHTTDSILLYDVLNVVTDIIIQYNYDLPKEYINGIFVV